MNGSILIYQNDDDSIHTEVKLENQTVWLTQS